MPNGLPASGCVLWTDKTSVTDAWVMRTGCQCLSISLRYALLPRICWFFSQQTINSICFYGNLSLPEPGHLNIYNTRTSKCPAPLHAKHGFTWHASPKDENAALLQWRGTPLAPQSSTQSINFVNSLPAGGFQWVQGSCRWQRCQTASGHLLEVYCWDGN